jgi:diaminopimelate epimerase
MKLEFTKMHGLGNDFVVLDGFRQELSLSAGQIRALADRRYGIGCDQVLLVQPDNDPLVDVRYRIFNAAGNEVEQCGNGARCIGRYLRQEGHVTGNVITAATMKGIITLYIGDDEQVSVNMGVPVFEPKRIPLQAPERLPGYSLELSCGSMELMSVSMGNPHAVLAVTDVEHTPVADIAREIQSSSLFPEGVNVGFMQIIDPSRIYLRVYERDVGETPACGTGACAAMVTGHLYQGLENEVDIRLTGGHLAVSWAGEGQPVWMNGPASTVFKGQIDL